MSCPQPFGTGRLPDPSHTPAARSSHQREPG